MKKLTSYLYLNKYSIYSFIIIILVHLIPMAGLFMNGMWYKYPYILGSYTIGMIIFLKLPILYTQHINNLNLQKMDIEKQNTNNKQPTPIELEPVLAEIHYMNDLGLSKWYEVVYMSENGEWLSYSGSKTFKDGEKVAKWMYCKDCLDN